MTDEELYRGYLAGDEAGLRELMERYGDSLTLYLNGYIHDLGLNALWNVAWLKAAGTVAMLCFVII